MLSFDVEEGFVSRRRMEEGLLMLDVACNTGRDMVVMGVVPGGRGRREEAR
jgi:hypothetical protein